MGCNAVRDMAKAAIPGLGAPAAAGNAWANSGKPGLAAKPVWPAFGAPKGGNAGANTGAAG